jgi:hypothetical protein
MHAMVSLIRVTNSVLGLSAVLLLAAAPARAATPAGEKFFEDRIRPVLVKHCYRCHSARAPKVRGGLRVDTRAALLEGGDSGPAVVPGKPEQSILLKALRHRDGFAMPPDKKLPASVVADFARWIMLGALGPREDKTIKTSRTTWDVKTGRKFWAFQPPRRYALPAVRDRAWPRTRIDFFLLASLEKRGLRPARDADRLTLLRRATLDLTGLPPTAAEADAFLADRRPGAFARVVDRLLASPAFGERWGRHWLDVARYADSTGKGDNLTYHEAWRYRDYVIAAFNRDKPYDRFVREQVAGDLLPAPSQAVRDEQLTATGFLVVGPKVLANRDVKQRQMDVVDDQVDTVGRAFLGLTLGCARCHDHKFDPIPTADYYALAGIFASTRTLAGTKLNNPAVSGWSRRPLGPGGDKLLAARTAFEAKLNKVRTALGEARSQLGEEGRRRVRELTAAEKKLLAAAPPAPPLVLAVRDEDRPIDIRVHRRGSPHSLGERVPRGFLRVAAFGPAPRIGANRSGRRELADWLANRTNPLTARVMVNRVWLHLFGEGLVRSPDNFGVRGDRPTHPELLDDLAVDFMEHGWSVKRLVHTIMLSRAYRMAVVSNPQAAQVDPANRLLWRANRRRLEVEAIRDCMLAVAGRLNRTMGGSSVAHLGEQAVSNNNSGPGLALDRLTRRSVYLPVIRNELPTIFEVFDFADPDVTTGRRDATTVATQALYLMNSPFALAQARAAAERLLALPEAARLTTLYRRAFGRPPTAREARRVRAFLGDYRRGPSSARAEKAAWTAVCQAVFGSTEVRFVE